MSSDAIVVESGIDWLMCFKALALLSGIVAVSAIDVTNNYASIGSGLEAFCLTFTGLVLSFFWTSGWMIRVMIIICPILSGGVTLDAKTQDARNTQAIIEFNQTIELKVDKLKKERDAIHVHTPQELARCRATRRSDPDYCISSEMEAKNESARKQIDSLNKQIELLNSQIDYSVYKKEEGDLVDQVISYGFAFIIPALLVGLGSEASKLMFRLESSNSSNELEKKSNSKTRKSNKIKIESNSKSMFSNIFEFQRKDEIEDKATFTDRQLEELKDLYEEMVEHNRGNEIKVSEFWAEVKRLKLKNLIDYNKIKLWWKKHKPEPKRKAPPIIRPEARGPTF